MTSTNTKQNQPRLEEGDVVKVLEAHDRRRPGELLVIEEVIRADDPENDSGEEYSIANGSRSMGSTVLTSKVERVYTKAEYEQAYPKWGSVTDQIKDALSGLDDVSYVEVATGDMRLDPGEHSGTSLIELSFRRDDGHIVHANVRVTGRVLPLDEME